MSIAKLLKRHSLNPKVRRSARWSRLYKYSKRNNFQIYRPHLIWFENEKFLAAKAEWAKRPGMPDDRRFFLFNTAHSVRNVPGDTADIGVRFGTSSFFIQRGINNLDKPHHMFDSFEGLSEPTTEDEKGTKTTWKKGDLTADENVTRQNMSIFPACKIYRGWVPDRFPEVADRKFCFVHIDVDLFQPTLQSLEFFYERVSPGGAIVCDDYGFASCVGAKKAFDDFFADKPETIIHIPTGQALVIKR